MRAKLHNKKHRDPNTATYYEIRDYFSSYKCDWTDIHSNHPDIKFVNHLKNYCKTLRNSKVAVNDKNALELITKSLVKLDWKILSETKRLLITCWQGVALNREQVENLFRMMANKLLQDIFNNSVKEIRVLNFSELKPFANDSKGNYRLWIGSSGSSISSVGKRKCHLCNKPAIFDTNVCYEHNPK